MADKEKTEVPDPADTEKRLRSGLSIAKRNHTRICNALIKILTDPSSTIDIHTYVDQEHHRCHTLLDKLDRALQEYLAFLGEDDDGETDQNHELQRTVNQNYHVFIKRIQVSDDKSEKTSEERICQPSLRVPDLPAFDNTIRNYPKFKRDFRTHYEKYYGVHAVIVLKNNLLEGYSKEVCSGAQSVDAVFSELDIIYGDTGRLVETVMFDIEKTKPCSENSLTELQALRNIIRLAELDLEGVGLVQHIKQYQTVISVTRKLSTMVQRRWAEKIATENIPTDKRYDKLMEFIELEVREL